MVSRRGAGWQGSERSAVGYRGVTCPWQGEGRGGERAPSTLLPPQASTSALPSSLHIDWGRPRLQPRSSTSSLPVLLLLLLNKFPVSLKKKKKYTKPSSLKSTTRKHQKKTKTETSSVPNGHTEHAGSGRLACFTWLHSLSTLTGPTGTAGLGLKTTTNPRNPVSPGAGDVPCPVWVAGTAAQPQPLGDGVQPAGQEP